MRGQARHLREQPLLGRCGSGTGRPASTSSIAARSNSPVTGRPLPGVESTSTVHSGYWSTAFGVNVDYDFRPNIKVTGGFSYAILDYKKARGAVGAFDRDDNYVRFEIGVLYLPTENFYIGPGYTYTSRGSNLPGADFARHVFSIRVAARL